MYQIIDGKKLADAIIEDIARRVREDTIEPQIAVILVGNDPASHLYVSLKSKACERAGIALHKYLIDENESEEKVIETIKFLNDDHSIDAILIQLPLPEKMNQDRVLATLDYRKDVDGFHKKNIERYLAGKKQRMLPGLCGALWNLIASTGSENYIGKHALIVAWSKEFTSSLSKVLGDEGVIVKTILPTDARLAEKARGADILIVTAGMPKFITADMVQEGATVIDVGINKVDGKIVGDVDFERVAPKTKFITPVPGGVGPMTVAMLLFNTYVLAKNRKKLILWPGKNI